MADGIGPGALLGALAGLVAGLVGELGVLLVSVLFPTDVRVLGFAITWSVLLGTGLGAYAGWRGLWPDRTRRAVVAAAPGFVAGFVAMLMQFLAA